MFRWRSESTSAPIAGPCKTAFFTTGAEAVENAVKIARAYTGRPGLITFGGGFHGRTYMTMALTGKVAPYKLGFGPFPGSVFHGQYPNALYGVTTEDAMNSTDRLFKADIDPKQVAAIVLEPVQGEGGFNVAPAEFMQALRALCDQHGILLIADEVQTGFARTGKLFAMEHYSVKPDLITMAKSTAGGMPLSAVAGRAEVMDAPAPGGLGGTYAGNPLAVAAAHAVLDVIDEEQLCQRAQRLGQHGGSVAAGAQNQPGDRRCARARLDGGGGVQRSGHRQTICRYHPSGAAEGDGRRAAAAELRRERQRDSLPVPADHPGRSVHQGDGHPVSRAGPLRSERHEIEQSRAAAQPVSDQR